MAAFTVRTRKKKKKSPERSAHALPVLSLRDGASVRIMADICKLRLRRNGRIETAHARPERSHCACALCLAMAAIVHRAQALPFKFPTAHALRAAIAMRGTTRMRVRARPTLRMPAEPRPPKVFPMRMCGRVGAPNRVLVTTGRPGSRWEEAAHAHLESADCACAQRAAAWNRAAAGEAWGRGVLRAPAGTRMAAWRPGWSPVPLTRTWLETRM